jgi:hypothetical protein
VWVAVLVSPVGVVFLYSSGWTSALSGRAWSLLGFFGILFRRRPGFFVILASSPSWPLRYPGFFVILRLDLA